MIDFQNGDVFKLKQVPIDTYSMMVAPLLVNDEVLIGAYQTVRDGVVFTNKREITINIQGITGKKKDFSSLPYSKVQVFAVETAGVQDLDSELELYFSGLGKIKFLFTGKSDILKICQAIGEYIL